MLVTITCPECNTDGRFSVVEESYEGPYKCWKCRQLLFIELDGRNLKSCRPLDDQKFERLQQVEKLKRKFNKDDD